MTPLAAAVAELIALGVEGDALVAAIGRLEQAMYVNRVERQRSSGAERQARYIERKRQKASESVTNDADDVTPVTSVSDSLSLPLSPQTPQTPTHTHGDINTHTRKADRDPEGFGSFWEAYPRRVGKDEARKAFVKAVKRGAVLGELIGAVERDKARQWAGRDVDMIPHPSTWLNQGRWQDEPPQQQPTRSIHERPSRQAAQLDERYDNYRRALAGAEIAVERGAVEPSGGF